MVRTPHQGTVVVVLLIAALLPGGLSRASTIVTVPDGVSPGQPYRLMIVVAGVQVTFTDIGIQNGQVQDRAEAFPELAALNTTWKAVGSTFAVDARDNTATNPNVEVGVPIYTLSGALLATDNADLWDGQWSALPGSQTRAYWHGTGPDGTAFDAQALGYGSGFGPLDGPELELPKGSSTLMAVATSPKGSAQIGSISDVAYTQGLLDAGSASAGGGFFYGVTDDPALAGMMALSDVLIAPVPEPASAAVLLLGLGALTRRRAAHR